MKPSVSNLPLGIRRTYEAGADLVAGMHERSDVPGNGSLARHCRTNMKSRALRCELVVRSLIQFGDPMPLGYLQTFKGEESIEDVEDGQPLGHTYSTLYEKRGITQGDPLDLAWIDEDRQLNLISRLEVDRVEYDRYHGEHVVFPRRGTSTPTRMRRVVPLTVSQQLRFLVRNGFDEWGHPRYQSGNTALKFDEAGRLIFQAARTIRRLNADSARLLDEIIDKPD